MERSSHQLWNDRPNSVPYGLITKYVFVEKIVSVIAILSEHGGNAFLLFLRDEPFSVYAAVVAASPAEYSLHGTFYCPVVFHLDLVVDVCRTLCVPLYHSLGKHVTFAVLLQRRRHHSVSAFLLVAHHLIRQVFHTFVCPWASFEEAHRDVRPQVLNQFFIYHRL